MFVRCACIALLLAMPSVLRAEPLPPPSAEAAAKATAAEESSPVVGCVTGETTVYDDSDSVSVVSPAVSGAIAGRDGKWSARGDYLVDVISAASIDAVTAASRGGVDRWNEVRHQVRLEGTYQPSVMGLRASGILSREPDAATTGGGADVLVKLSERGDGAFIGYERDQLVLGRRGVPFSVLSHTLGRNDIRAGVALVPSERVALSVIADVFVENGDATNPYRGVPLFDPRTAAIIPRGASIDTVNRERVAAAPEALPEKRVRYALTTRLAMRLPASVLRLTERLYADSWSLLAATTDARYVWSVSPRADLWPWARFHLQSATSFWKRAYTASAPDGQASIPQYRTGDRQLGPLSTLGAGAGGRVHLGPTEDPSSIAVRLEGGILETWFTDDLYVTSRTAGLGTLSLEGAFR